MSEMNENMLTSFPAELLSKKLEMTEHIMLANTSHELRNHLATARRVVKLKNKKNHSLSYLTDALNTLKQNYCIQRIELESLHLNLNSHDSIDLFEMIQSCETLSELTFRRNKIGAGGDGESCGGVRAMSIAYLSGSWQ